MQFWVEKNDTTKELAAELNLNEIDYDFSALITDMNITLNITKINIDSVKIVSDTFGKLSALTLKLKLNNGFRIVLPLLNIFLSKFHLQFPSDIFGIFQLSDLVLEYFDGYIYAGATPTFLPPALDYGMNDMSDDLAASTLDGHSHPTHAPERTVHYQGNEFMFIEQ